MFPILLSYLAAALVAYAGSRARALTRDGGIAACLVGGTVLGFGGPGPALLLVLFFASSSLLSFLKSDDARKQKAAQTFEKGGRRDAAQVFANGGIAAVLALFYGTGLGSFFPAGAASILAAFTGALAAATADTWATEIGVLSSRLPRLVTTGKPVPPGTSGGITALGTAASAGGAILIGLAAAALAVFAAMGAAGPGGFALLVAGILGGIGGSLADSLLGATVQAGYFCPACGVPTESPVHSCGGPTYLVKGLPRINNDIVNNMATLVGALVGGLAGLLL